MAEQMESELEKFIAQQRTGEQMEAELEKLTGSAREEYFKSMTLMERLLFTQHKLFPTRTVEQMEAELEKLKDNESARVDYLNGMTSIERVIMA